MNSVLRTVAALPVIDPQLLQTQNREGTRGGLGGFRYVYLLVSLLCLLEKMSTNRRYTGNRRAGYLLSRLGLHQQRVTSTMGINIPASSACYLE